MRSLRRALAVHVGGLPSRFWWIWVGSLVSALATFVFLFLAVYLTARGLDAGQVGLVGACFGLGTLAAGPIGGTFADRAGRRPTLIGALVASAACATLLGLLQSPAAIVPAVFLFGVASSAVLPALFAMIADVVPETDRQRAFALLYWANNVGISLSAIVGGAVGERSWVALFLADAATTTLFALVVWRKLPESGGERGAGRAAQAQDGRAPLPEPRRGEEDAARGAGPLVPAPAAGPARGWGVVLSDGPFVAFVAVFIVFLAVFFQFQVAMPVAMRQAGFSTAQIGLVLAVNGVLIGLLSPFAARVLGARDRGRVLALGAVLVGAGYGAYALCSTATQWALATAVWTLGEIITMPVAIALVSELAPEDLRGRYNGLYSLAFGAGQTLAPLVGGPVLAAAGRNVLFGGCLGMCLLVAAGHLALGAARRGRVERREGAAA